MNMIILLFIVLCRLAFAESMQIQNQDFIDMISTPASELQTDCFDCKNAENINPVKKLNEKIKIDWQKVDIAKFCEENLKNGVAKRVYQRSDEELNENIKSKNFEFLELGSDWLGSIYPSYELRLQHHSRLLNLVARPIKLTNPQELEKFLDHIIKNDINLKPDSKTWDSYTKAEQAMYFYMDGFSDKSPEIAEGKLKALEASTNVDQGQDFKKVKAAISILCTQYGLRDVNDCAKGLELIISLMTPKNNLTVLPVVREVLNDPDYVYATKMIALKIQSKVEKGGIPEGDFFSDIYEGFLNLDLAPDVAEEKAFNLIGVLSSRGPNIGNLYDFFSTKNRSLYESMKIISTGVTVLNSASQGTGHLYSYPSNVKGNCDNGKNYHFWMSAFLARKVTKTTGNANAAISSTYLSSIGYQMKAETDGRDSRRAFVVDTFDPANNKIRMDLAWAGAGAVYGASIAEKKKLKNDLNADEGLRKLLKNAGNMKTITEKEAEKKWQGSGIRGYRRWRQIFSPDSLIDYYKKSR